jgi:uncharacterized protein (TIGR03382 family)
MLAHMRALVRSSLIATLALGAFAPVASAEPTLSVSFKTTQVGGTYAPKNCVAVWIQDAQGKFVKTLGRWAGEPPGGRRTDLIAWTAKAGLADVDAVTGATRIDNSGILMVTWDLKDKLGAPVPDGIYTIRMELADEDVTASGQNNQGTFTFTKGLAPEMQSIPGTLGTNGSFLNVEIKFDPNANACNNNVVDPGETCDPPGSCPTTCAASGDACAPNELTGDAATCTAACAVRPISACTPGDGCCAVGCTAATDSDCADGAQDISSGCEAGNGGGGLLAFALVGLTALVTRRRR